MKTLIDKECLQARISAMAREIDQYYLKQDWYQETQESVVVIGVLNGALFFMADLVRQLTIRIELDFIKVSTYPGKSITPQNSKINLWPQTEIHDSAHVLLLDDILDSGQTLGVIEDHMLFECPLSLKTAVLLRKPGKAKNLETVHFVGFDIEDKWVAGYGMDNDNRHREIPFIFEVQ